MSGTADTEFSIGQQYWCMHRSFPRPILGTIISLTDAPGKQIGLEFSEADGLFGRHSCDGKGIHGRCIWSNVDNILNQSEYNAISEQIANNLIVSKMLVGNNYERMTIDDDNRVVGGEFNIEIAKSNKPMMPAVRG